MKNFVNLGKGRKILNLLFLLTFLFFFIPVVDTLDVSQPTSSDITGVNIVIPESPTNYSLLPTVNSSEFAEVWVTAQGNMDNVPDIDYSDFGGSSFWDIDADLGEKNILTTGTGTFGTETLILGGGVAGIEIDNSPSTAGVFQDGTYTVYIADNIDSSGSGAAGIDITGGVTSLRADGDIKQDDDAKHYFGDADDSSITYNGSDLIINPKEVGSGKVFIAGTGSANNLILTEAGGISIPSMLTLSDKTGAGTELGVAIGSGFSKISDGSEFFNLWGTGIGTTIFGGGISDDAYRRFRITTEGKMYWGSGSAGTDTNLYRNSANVLKTDDDFSVGGNILTPTITGEAVVFGTSSGGEVRALNLMNSATASSTAVALKFTPSTSSTSSSGAEIVSTRTNSPSSGSSNLIFRTSLGFTLFDRMLIDTAGDVHIFKDLNVSGNITSENVFIPQYIFVHTNHTIPLPLANVWENITFVQEDADLKQGISHVYNDGTNHTFTIGMSGVYDVEYDFDVEDTSVGASDIDVAGRVIYTDGAEVNGSVFESDITKQGTEVEISHTFLAEFNAGDQIVFQFVATDADVQISTHGTFGVFPESASIVIEKIANLK